MTSIEQVYTLALEHHRAGRLPEAEALYRQILAEQPNHFKAVKGLGTVNSQMGRHNLAVEWLCKAVALEPNDARAWSNLGTAFAAQRQFSDALTAYRRALALKSDYADAAYNLANALRDCGELDEALATYRRALEIQPNYAAVWNNMGIAFRLKRRHADAAIAHRRAVEINPDSAEARINLGEALVETGEIGDAIAALERVLEIRPDYAEAHYNLGIALEKAGRLDDAVAAYRRALQLNPSYAEARNNLGNALKEQGLLHEALAAYRQASSLRPDVPEIQSNIIFALHFHPDEDGHAIAQEQQRWRERFSDPHAKSISPHANQRDPEKRLRVGYVSSDFRDHVAGFNVLPLLRCHGHRNFEILCYSGVEKPDTWTAVFQKTADRWRSTVGLSDEALAEVIRQDAVDILVDLSQHTAGNRLSVFARKPAPIQVSFAGYPESTGIDTIENRISDRWLEADASKIGVRSSEFGSAPSPDLRSPISDLPAAERVSVIDSFWCYDPCGIEVPVNELPAQESGFVTFGSFSKSSKLNEPVLHLWARVLASVKNARLILRSSPGSQSRRVLELFAQAGIAEDRVEFVTTRPRKDYFELHHRVDIALDPFPYGGHTTSLDALWMGVPVVTLAGHRPVSRAGLSILSNLGLPELAATSKEAYVNIAAQLARNLPALASLRQCLRPRMETSVLMDAPRFARGIEAAYRTMWRRWCAQERS